MVVAGVTIIAFGFLMIRLINVNHRAMFNFKGDLFRNHSNVILMDSLCFVLFVAGPLMLNILPLSIRIIISVGLVIFLGIDVRRRSELAMARKIIRIYKSVKATNTS